MARLYLGAAVVFAALVVVACGQTDSDQVAVDGTSSTTIAALGGEDNQSGSVEPAENESTQDQADPPGDTTARETLGVDGDTGGGDPVDGDTGGGDPVDGDTGGDDPVDGDQSVANPGQDVAPDEDHADQQPDTGTAADQGPDETIPPIDPDSTAEPSGPTTQPEGEPVEPDLDAADDPAADGRFEIDHAGGQFVDLATGASTNLSTEIGNGGLTLLWFWTPSSSTAEREAAVVDRFSATFGDTIKALAVGTGEDRADAERFLQSTGLGAPILWAPESDVEDHYGLTVIPSSVLIDGAGNVVGRWDGLPEEVFVFAERLS